VSLALPIASLPSVCNLQLILLTACPTKSLCGSSTLSFGVNLLGMDSTFPTSTLIIALCFSTFNLLAHAAGVAAYHCKKENQLKSTRIILQRQTVHSTFVFCSVLTALFIAEFPKINTSPKVPLAWCFVSLVFSEV
jgi:hypothetical protein